MKRILAVLICVLATFSVAGAQRLPEVARPENYKLTFTPNLETATFEGDETISIRVLKPTSEITLNAADIDIREATITSGGATQKVSGTCDKEKEEALLAVEKPLAPGAATIHITYAGKLNDEMRGLYMGKDDQGRKYAASQFEATDARRAFPSFDEPAFKAMKGRGLSVLVRRQWRRTSANIWLRPPGELRVFLKRWLAACG